MLKYGGVYIDIDAIFVRRLSNELRAYDAVVTLAPITTRPFPNIVSDGLIVGKPGSRFWELWQVSY